MPAKRSGIITLLTDFGTRDHFAGVMKGVIAGIAPKSRVVDISHDGPAFGLRAARFLLGQSWKWFPPGTVHLAVVDPGVGTTRRGLAVEAGGHLFVGPDNGLLSEPLRLPGAKARELSAVKYRLKETSQTFHGRDVFAPAAAHLSAGLAVSKLGPQVNNALVVTTDGPLRTGKRFWQGEIAYVDRYGNLITNLPIADFPEAGSREITLRVGFAAITGLQENYAAGPPGEPVVVVGSSGNLEVAVNQGDAAKCLGVGVGSPVELEIR